jgi:hypothetical protein
MRFFSLIGDENAKIISCGKILLNVAKDFDTVSKNMARRDA